MDLGAVLRWTTQHYPRFTRTNWPARTLAEYDDRLGHRIALLVAGVGPPQRRVTGGARTQAAIGLQAEDAGKAPTYWRTPTYTSPGGSRRSGAPRGRHQKADVRAVRGLSGPGRRTRRKQGSA